MWLCFIHCPKNNLNVWIQSESVLECICTLYCTYMFGFRTWHNGMLIKARHLPLHGLQLWQVFMWRIRLFLVQCKLEHSEVQKRWINNLKSVAQYWRIRHVLQYTYTAYTVIVQYNWAQLGANKMNKIIYKAYSSSIREDVACGCVFIYNWVQLGANKMNKIIYKAKLDMCIYTVPELS